LRLTDILQKLVRDCLNIFALIIILLTILRQIYHPHLAFDLKSIYIIMAFSLISALTGLILLNSSNNSEQSIRLKIVIHFVTLEFLLVSLAAIFNIVTSISDGVILALQVAVIYILVRLLSWQRNKKEADQINEKLKAYKTNETIQS
jgi:hypothetical protein